MKIWIQKTDLFGRPTWVNKDLVQPLKEVQAELKSKQLDKEVKSVCGGLSVRYVRGREKQRVLSTHAYGLSIDLNCFLGYPSFRKGFSCKFVQTFEDAGFSWGGVWKQRADPMHFSWIKPVNYQRATEVREGVCTWTKTVSHLK